MDFKKFANFRYLTFLSVTLIIFFTLNVSKIGATDVISPWSVISSLPYKLANHTAFSILNKLYVIGGSAVTGESHSEILQASINSDGSISNWSTISHLPQRLIWHSSVNNNNHVFVLGGFLDSIDGLTENVNSVYSSKINVDGSLDSWSTLNPLPQTLSLGATEIVGDRIYYAGGVTDAHFMYETDQDIIYMATINNIDETISPWTTAGHLAYPNFGMKIKAIGNYLYEFGGFGYDSSSRVRRAVINSDGTIGDWEIQNYFYHGISMFGLAQIGEYLFVVGGNAGGPSNKILYSKINPDHTISEWNEVSETSRLPTALSNLAVAVSGNRIYSIGGHNSSLEGYYNKVYMTEFVGLSATNTPSPTPSPSPSPSPSPLASPEPTATAGTPTALPVNKVIFAPGLGGSWNLDAIINCKTSNFSGTWQLAPYAKTVYQPFFDAMGNTNWKLKEFYYDWRNDVRQNGNLLNNFINSNTVSGEKVNFVGHSMGGLVGRTYMESNLGGKLNSYFSVGTPHLGAVDAYPIANKQVWNDDLVQKIAQTLLIKRCGVPFSINNVLPTFDYLKNSKNNQIKPVSSMNLKNNYLPSDFVSPFWGVKVGTLSGNNFDTLRYLKVTNNWFYTDGKPTGKDYSKSGDGTVLTFSSQLEGADNQIINETHSGIIGTTIGINKILDFLGTEPAEDPPFYEPKSALVIIGYPGNFWIKDKKGKVIQSDQGVISIINPSKSDFDFKLIPQSPNSLMIIAQFLPNGEVKYKEYKHWGFHPMSKHLHFDPKHPKDDICER